MAAEPCWRVYYVGGPSDSPDEIICLTSQSREGEVIGTHRTAELAR